MPGQSVSLAAHAECEFHEKRSAGLTARVGAGLSALGSGVGVAGTGHARHAGLPLGLLAELPAPRRRCRRLPGLPPHKQL